MRERNSLASPFLLPSSLLPATPISELDKLAREPWKRSFQAQLLTTQDMLEKRRGEN